MLVQLVPPPPFESAFPVAGSMTPIRGSSRRRRLRRAGTRSPSSGEQWTMTGPPKSRARRSADSTARDVVAVHRADVLQAEVLEHALRLDDVLDALLDPVQGLEQRRRPAGCGRAPA
jgi:hypothetical protein